MKEIDQYLVELVNEKDSFVEVLEDLDFETDVWDKVGVKSNLLEDLIPSKHEIQPLNRMEVMYVNREQDFDISRVHGEYEEMSEPEAEEGIFLDHCVAMGIPQRAIWSIDTFDFDIRRNEYEIALKDFYSGKNITVDRGELEPSPEGMRVFTPSSMCYIIEDTLKGDKQVCYPSNLDSTMRRNGFPDYVVEEYMRILSELGESVPLGKYDQKTEDGRIAAAADERDLTLVSVDGDFPLGKLGMKDSYTEWLTEERKREAMQTREEIHQIDPEITSPVELSSDYGIEPRLETHQTSTEVTEELMDFFTSPDYLTQKLT